MNAPLYYARRLVNPFRGVLQVVDVGEASADTTDGVHWRLICRDDYGLRIAGTWRQDAPDALQHCPQRAALAPALAAHPPLPFAPEDSLELWLLDKETTLPLALLATARPESPLPRIDPEWHPFPLRYTRFRSATLAERDAHHPRGAAPHRDVLARLVNLAARPYPAAQWFERRADGSGIGLGGLRLEPGWEGRRLGAEAFPELLVKPCWPTTLETALVAEYHAWLAPYLLLLPSLSPATRAELEVAAAAHPAWLMRVHRLLPTQCAPERIQAILVAARMQAGQDEADADLLPD